MPPIDYSTELESVVVAIEAMSDDPRLRKPHLYNALSLLHETLGKDSWVGLYLLEGDDLFLGPFQGTMACEVIHPSRGVVGECFFTNKTIYVQDVSTWPNYICCDPKAKSEICVPLRNKHGTCIGVLDIDLADVHDFQNEVKPFEKAAISLLRFLNN